MRNEMKRVLLGNSGIEVTELCFGTLTMSCLQTDMPSAEGGRIIAHALELGVDFIDTAQAYRTYEHVAAAIKRRKNKPVIATKSHARTYEEMNKAVEQALEIMGLDRLDIFLFHLTRSEEDYLDRRGAIDCLLEYKQKGLIRALGLSTHTLEGLKPAFNHTEIEIVLACINSKGLGINDASLDQFLPALRKLHAQGKGVYAMKPLGGGHLFHDVAPSLNFVRRLDTVDVLAVGMKSVAEVEMNVCIFNDQPVPAQVQERAKQVSKQLKIYTHICQGCGSCVAHCDQGALSLQDEKVVVDQSKCILCGYCAEECPVFCIRVI
ncbi:MAG: aldo/keto reductase [Candidatus Abyssobacteria bacterium SURF_5]|uniref:Aldo/keto reductase n=1 Tax=Abyssobacteria bacterium (strain SURF_5) TaxID=2093360 RepID=A0A3A4NSX3_ABYX5|nr:MAG: aldo/keto reductase [Candidatus Abyssubacteria bacterium SURF_5]